jgi:acetyl-CoA synthetase
MEKTLSNQHLHQWEKEAQQLSWIKPWETTTSGSFKSGNIKWFEEGYLNVCYNCVDRHLESQPNKTAIIWEGEKDNSSKSLTYKELYIEVSKFANTLKKIGVKKGNIVSIYMPMIIDSTVAMLACARIGAIHSVIFAGFSPESIKERIQDTKSEFIITCDGGYRAGKIIELKKNIDTAIQENASIKKVLTLKHTHIKVNMKNGRDIDFDEIKATDNDYCPIEPMNAEDPLFILYTSGSTGKPKGIQHSTGGYLLYSSFTHKTAFDIKPNDIYWCTADIGWITGHSYVVYGPLCNGCTNIIYEGAPSYPSYARYFEIIDKYNVTVFYTAPTAIRLLMAQEPDVLSSTNRNSLRILATVGEPINTEAWEWYSNKVGNNKCPIIDTWWQTETGGIMISPPTHGKQKPGSAMQPIPGISPVILDKNTFKEIDGALKVHDYGILAIKEPWPGIMRTVYGDHDRYISSYFKEIPGYYIPSDGAYRDEDGDFWITGRLDDVISIAGHRIGTAEIEDTINSHPSVTECAVVGVPNQLRGESIYAYITLPPNTIPSTELKSNITRWLREKYGPFAHISAIQWSPSLPKTRSGKIMRRVLRKICLFNENEIGDTSTLMDEECIKSLITDRIDYRKA